MDLSFIRKYVERNPYTGSAGVDLEGVAEDAALKRLLREVWDAGYNSGFDDGVADCTVESQSGNPYL